MKHFLRLTCFATAILTVAACREVDFTDGKIPQGYEQEAQRAVGTYTGYVEAEAPSGLAIGRRAETLTVTYENERLILQPSVDWLGDGCGSKIGNLLSAEVSGDQITTATFAFDGGDCKTPAMSNQFVVRILDPQTDHEQLAASVTTSTSIRTEYGGVPRHITREARGVLKRQ